MIIQQLNIPVGVELKEIGKIHLTYNIGIKISFVDEYKDDIYYNINVYTLNKKHLISEDSEEYWSKWVYDDDLIHYSNSFNVFQTVRK